MADTLKLSQLALKQPYKVLKADSGGITFRIVARPGYWNWKITFMNKQCPHRILYEMNSKDQYSHIVFKKEGQKMKADFIPHCISYAAEPQKFWLTWVHNTIQMGQIIESSIYDKPIFVFKDKSPAYHPNDIIGFIKFSADNHVNFDVESRPALLRPISLKVIEKGKLRWERMINNKLPYEALVGGFENEPIYIARAIHGRTMCPGKFVPSKRRAFVTSGSYEHAKKSFEILCGFDAIWVKCTNNIVPENVFKDGLTQRRGLNLFIGRAMIGDHLVVGKVFTPADTNTCCLPYNGSEVQVNTFEILAHGNTPVGVTGPYKHCSMNPFRALHPCI